VFPEDSRDGFFKPGLINAISTQEIAGKIPEFRVLNSRGRMPGFHVELNLGVR
jgi:hypothetical protein